MKKQNLGDMLKDLMTTVIKAQQEMADPHEQRIMDIRRQMSPIEVIETVNRIKRIEHQYEQFIKDTREITTVHKDGGES